MAHTDRLMAVVDIEVLDMDKFRDAAKACADATLSEPGTLVYDYYIDEDRKRARLIEIYDSREAYEAHLAGPVFTGVGAGMVESCRFTSVELFGNFDKSAPGPRLVMALWPHTKFWDVPFASGSNP